jgi:hypothetical protein
MGNYDFEHIAYYAKKRFIEGCNTIDMLEAAASDREKEEIALVSLLYVEDDKIQELRLSCKYAGQCKTIDCRDRLKRMLEEELAVM